MLTSSNRAEPPLSCASRDGEALPRTMRPPTKRRRIMIAALAALFETTLATLSPVKELDVIWQSSVIVVCSVKAAQPG
jgi:hypothetical protein